MAKDVPAARHAAAVVARKRPARAYTCLNRKPGKHSFLSLKAGEIPFHPQKHIVGSVKATYDNVDGTVTEVDWDFAKKLRFGTSSDYAKIILKGELTGFSAGPDGDPITGTLTITLISDPNLLPLVTPPEVVAVIDMVFVDDPDPANPP